MESDLNFHYNLLLYLQEISFSYIKAPYFYQFI